MNSPDYGFILGLITLLAGVFSIIYFVSKNPEDIKSNK